MRCCLWMVVAVPLILHISILSSAILNDETLKETSRLTKYNIGKNIASNKKTTSENATPLSTDRTQ